MSRGDRVRWVLMLGALAAFDGWAGREQWRLWTEPISLGPAGRIPGSSWGSEYYADGRVVQLNRNVNTGGVTRTETRPATPIGRLAAAWPGLASLAITLLTLGLAGTARGWRLFRAILTLRMPIWGMMALVTVAGAGFGLIHAGVDPAIVFDPEYAWPVVGFLALASLPAVLVLLYARLAAIGEPDSPSDRT